MTPYFSTQPKLFRYGINIYEGGWYPHMKNIKYVVVSGTEYE
jgi:hypothetical protein